MEPTDVERKAIVVVEDNEPIAELIKETLNAEPDYQAVVVNDSGAMCQAAVLGLGVALVVVPDVLAHLRSRALVRLLPKWYADIGAISLYYANRTLLPAKTRAFVDHVTETFRRDRLAERFAGSIG